ncbi:hypothetical protein LCGC14_0245680 [marine sediment metagenome]|uniref:Uncharacterized protein n=1 Tax=marine sediment metagenome TaxID=412755 RepID=A0A0F9UME0_9ZZZZ
MQDVTFGTIAGQLYQLSDKDLRLLVEAIGKELETRDRNRRGNTTYTYNSGFTIKVRAISSSDTSTNSSAQRINTRKTQIR